LSHQGARNGLGSHDFNSKQFAFPFPITEQKFAHEVFLHVTRIVGIRPDFHQKHLSTL
jgi:hypothetical protein